MLDSNNYGSGIDPCRTSLNLSFNNSPLPFFNLISTHLSYHPSHFQSTSRAVLMREFSAIQEDFFTMISRACMHSDFFRDLECMRSTFPSTKPFLVVLQKREVIRLLAVRGIQKLQIQWQLKTMANEKLVVKLNCVLLLSQSCGFKNHSKYWGID